MYKTSLDEREYKVVGKLRSSDRARIDKLRGIFEKNGFDLSEVHLKRISKMLHELRSGRVRMLFGMIKDCAVITRVFIKATQKTPIKEIRLAEKRLKEYL